jgi:hypothetical protein
MVAVMPTWLVSPVSRQIYTQNHIGEHLIDNPVIYLKL